MTSARERGPVNAPGPRSSLWLWLLVAGAVLSHGSHSLLRPASTYKLIALEAGPATVGAVSALYALFPLVLALQLGARAQRAVSLKPLLLWGSAISALGAVLLAAGDSILFVGGGTAVMGLGQLIYIIAGQAAVGRFAENWQLDSVFGWLTAGVSAGQAVGPMLGGIMLDASLNGVNSHESLLLINRALWVGVGLAALLTVLMLFSGGAYRSRALSEEKGTARTANPGRAGARAGQILRTPEVPSHIFASSVSIAMMDILQSFLPLVGDRAGVSPFWVGVLLAVRACASFASRLLLPLLRRRFSRYTLVVTGLLVSGVTLASIPVIAPHLWASSLVMVVSGFFLGLAQPLTMSMVAQAVPDDWRSSALALRLVGNRLGQLILPVTAGAAAAPLGPAGAIWMASFCLLISGAEKLKRGSEPHDS